MFKNTGNFIGITIGDMNGIGPEVIIKALSHPKITEHFTPIIYGSSKVMAYHKNIVKDHNFTFVSIKQVEHAAHNKVNVFNVWDSVFGDDESTGTERAPTHGVITQFVKGRFTVRVENVFGKYLLDKFIAGPERAMKDVEED